MRWKVSGERLALHQQRRRPDRFRIRAREGRALLPDLAEQRAGVVAHPLLSLLRQVGPAAGPEDHLGRRLQTFVDRAATDAFGCRRVKGPERDRRVFGRLRRLEAGVEHAAGLDQHQCADEFGKGLRDPEGDVPPAGMTEQMDRSRFERGDEGRQILDMLLDREIVAFAVPALRPAMAKADGDCPAMRAEGLHLMYPRAIVAERPVHEEQGHACAALDERHIGSFTQKDGMTFLRAGATWAAAFYRSSTIL